MEIQITKDQKLGFKHIQFYSYDTTTSGHFPDFMIVGPQRTGTTWLTHNLKQHPEIYISTPKELYFFSRLTEEKNKYSRIYYNLNPVWLKRKPQFFLRQTFRTVYFDFIKTGRYAANQLDWYLKFFDIPSSAFKKLDGEMQKIYGENYRPKMRGEATASYAVVEPEIIQEIVKINPDIKIILMVRDPIDRAWSHAKKDLMRATYSSFHEIKEEEFMEFFSIPHVLKCGNYTEQLANWKQILPEGNLFVGLYDMISENPHALLSGILNFLGVDASDKYIGEKATTVINPTKTQEIPEKYQTVLEELFVGEKRKLAEEYNITFSSKVKF